MNLEKSVHTYLDTVFNTRDIPLNFLIRNGDCPTNKVIKIYKKIVWSDPLQGTAFNVDSKIVINPLKGLFNGTNSDSWIKGIWFGREVMHELQHHYDGDIES